jgi:hypothetical protein
VCYEENIIKREIDHELGEYKKTVIYGHWSKNRSQTKVVELNESTRPVKGHFARIGFVKSQIAKYFPGAGSLENLNPYSLA